MEKNSHIDKKFFETAQNEPQTFPGFDKVWANVEEKLDKKEPKKKIMTVWLYSGMAACLALIFGLMYFLKIEKDDNDVQKYTVAEKFQNQTEMIKISENNEVKKDEMVEKSAGFQGNRNKDSDEIIAAKNVSAKSKSEQTSAKLQSKKESSGIKTINWKQKMEDFKKENPQYPIAGNEKGHFDPQPFNNSSENSMRRQLNEVQKQYSNVLLNGNQHYTTDNLPLVIINGKISDFKTFNSIDPETIEKMEILKPEKAQELFDKAKNGVIVVTLKNTVDQKNANENSLDNK